MVVTKITEADSSQLGQEAQKKGKVWEVWIGHEENGSANLEEVGEGAEPSESLSLKVFEALKGKVMSEMTWCSCQPLLVEEAGPAALHSL